jgi:phage head maturation protease
VTTADTPRPAVDVLYRGRSDADALALRAAADGSAGSTLNGHFSRFDDWYEIDSWLEGRFIERTVKGAFKKTMAENRSRIVCSFDHGYDPQLGDKPLGPIEELREEDEGPYYEVPLLDTDYNQGFILPALQGRLIDGRMLGSTLGSSFRFRVIGEQWVNTPKRSAYNPDALPERTITEVKLFEFGPVVYPASPTATAGIRSLTDHFFARQLARSGQSERALRELATIASPSAAPGTDPTEPVEPPSHSPEQQHHIRSLTSWQVEIAKLRRRAA